MFYLGLALLLTSPIVSIKSFQFYNDAEPNSTDTDDNLLVCGECKCKPDDYNGYSLMCETKDTLQDIPNITFPDFPEENVFQTV